MYPYPTSKQAGNVVQCILGKEEMNPRCSDSITHAHSYCDKFPLSINCVLGHNVICYVYFFSHKLMKTPLLCFEMLFMSLDVESVFSMSFVLSVNACIALTVVSCFKFSVLLKKGKLQGCKVKHREYSQ